MVEAGQKQQYRQSRVNQQRKAAFGKDLDAERRLYWNCFGWEGSSIGVVSRSTMTMSMTMSFVVVCVCTRS